MSNVEIPNVYLEGPSTFELTLSLKPETKCFILYLFYRKVECSALCCTICTASVPAVLLVGCFFSCSL